MSHSYVITIKYIPPVQMQTKKCDARLTVLNYNNGYKKSVFTNSSREITFSGTLEEIIFKPGCLWGGATFSIRTEKLAGTSVALTEADDTTVGLQSFYGMHLSLEIPSNEFFYKFNMKWPTIQFLYETVPDYWHVQINTKGTTANDTLYVSIDEYNSYVSACQTQALLDH